MPDSETSSELQFYFLNYVKPVGKKKNFCFCILAFVLENDDKTS